MSGQLLLNPTPEMADDTLISDVKLPTSGAEGETEMMVLYTLVV